MRISDWSSDVCSSDLPRPAVAAAVSGGPDSLALTFLLHDWLAERGGRLATFTVDHGLRPDSAREAASVGRLLRRHGIADRKSVVEGKSVSVRVDLGGRRIIKNKKYRK